MPARFYYIVHRSTEHWEVSSGFNGARISCDSANEALQIARAAARRYWEARSEPSGVLLVRADSSAREESLFG
jgi:hypothetical protein